MFKFKPQLRVGNRYHGIKYEHVNTLKIQNVWKVSDGWSSSTSWKYLKPLARLIKRRCESWNANCITYIKSTAATTAPHWCCQKITLLTKKWTKSALNEKSMFFALSHFNNFYGTHGHIAKANSISKHTFKV